MRKKNRQLQILKLIESDDIGSQQDLLDALNRDGVTVSQSTLSKDLKEMGVIKLRGREGQFKFIQTRERDTFHTEVMLKRELIDYLHEIVQVGNLVLLKTAAGNASGVSKSVDDIGWEEVKGTLASVDTVLVVTASDSDAITVVDRLQEILKE